MHLLVQFFVLVLWLVKWVTFPHPLNHKEPQPLNHKEPQPLSACAVLLLGCSCSLWLVLACSGWLLVITSLISGRSSSFWVVLAHSGWLLIVTSFTYDVQMKSGLSSIPNFLTVSSKISNQWFTIKWFFVTLYLALQTFVAFFKRVKPIWSQASFHSYIINHLFTSIMLVNINIVCYCWFEAMFRQINDTPFKF